MKTLIITITNIWNDQVKTYLTNMFSFVRPDFVSDLKAQNINETEPENPLYGYRKFIYGRLRC